jgi:NitT/TauT family transport system substrate-binding protein
MKGLSLRACAGALVCTVTLLAGRAQANDAVTIQLDWVPGGIYAAWYYGLANRCFSDRGIDLKIARGYGAGDAITKVATGTSEFGITDLGAMIASRAKTGAAVKAIMPIVSDSPFAVVVMATSPIHSLKELEGKRVAAAAGDAGMQFLPIGMKLAGADFSKIIRINAEPAALAGLLFQGRVDALTSYVVTAVNIRGAAKQIGKDIRVLPFGQSLEIYNASVFTSDKIIGQDPGLVKRFYEASVCAHDGSRKHLDAAIDDMVSRVSGMQRENQVDMVRAHYAFAFDSPTFAKYGYTWNPARVEHTIEIVKIAQNIDAKLDPKDFVYDVK